MRHIRSEGSKARVSADTGPGEEGDETHDQGKDHRHLEHPGTDPLGGIDERRDDARYLEAVREEFRADNQGDNTAEHLPHRLEHRHGVLEDLFRAAEPDKLNEDHEHPDKEECGDRVELHGRNDEFREDDHQGNRQKREDRVPDRHRRHLFCLDLIGVLVDIVPLSVVIALHEVVADSNRDECRDRDGKLILHEVDDRVEPGDFSREVRGA